MVKKAIVYLHNSEMFKLKIEESLVTSLPEFEIMQDRIKYEIGETAEDSARRISERTQDFSNLALVVVDSFEDNTPVLKIIRSEGYTGPAIFHTGYDATLRGENEKIYDEKTLHPHDPEVIRKAVQKH